MMLGLRKNPTSSWCTILPTCPISKFSLFFFCVSNAFLLLLTSFRMLNYVSEIWLNITMIYYIFLRPFILSQMKVGIPGDLIIINNTTFLHNALSFACIYNSVHVRHRRFPWFFFVANTHTSFRMLKHTHFKFVSCTRQMFPGFCVANVFLLLT